MFQVHVDEELNRLYVTIGDLQQSEPEYLKAAILEALPKLKPGWSCINDISEALTDNPENLAVLAEVMQAASTAGIGKVVRVVGKAKFMPTLFAKFSQREGAYSALTAATVQEAEELLADT